MTLKADRKELGDIVNQVRSRGYALRHELQPDHDTPGSRQVWRVYVKGGDDESTSRIAYVSDAGEILTRAAFSVSEDAQKERATLDQLIAGYRDASSAIAYVKEAGRSTVIYSTIGGGIIGFLFGRFPGAILGLIAGNLVGDLIRDSAIDHEVKKLYAYAQSRNIKAGADALASL